MTSSSPILRARIDTPALRHNLGVIKRTAPTARVMAVIKANAYGHGLVPVAMALSQADAFAVARIEEAAELRAAGVGHPVTLLEGVLSAAQLQQAQALQLQLVIHDASQIEMLEAAATSRPMSCWIKVNTGMNRLGFRVEQLPEVWRRLTALRPAMLTLNLMTHLACADDAAAPLTAQQLQQFALAREIVGQANGDAARKAGHAGFETSIGNSAGLFADRNCHGDWVRPGISLYGISPFAHRSGAALDLRPVMSLETRVIALHDVPAGEGVGYGSNWRAARNSRIAVLAAGYADGVPRQLPNGAPVLVAGQRAALAGRVSMDMMTVDVTGMGDVRVGSPALLWGEGLPAEDIAAAAGTIAYELLSRLGRRVALEYF